MNNTKWNEIFTAFYCDNECSDNGGVDVPWRAKSIDTGYVYGWDSTWTHFGCEPREWDKIDYLQILLSEENEEYVINTLKKIHVPGTVENGIVTIYGYKTNIDYI